VSNLLKYLVDKLFLKITDTADRVYVFFIARINLDSRLVSKLGYRKHPNVIFIEKSPLMK